MFRLLFLLLTVSLTLALGAGYFYLTKKIDSGERQLAVGQGQLDRGLSDLEDGQARLKAGKKELSEGKKEYRKASDNDWLVLLDDVLQGGEGFDKAREEIAEGDRQVAEGGDAVAVGKAKLEAGAKKMDRGRKQLGLARDVRAACAIGAGLFAFLSIFLGFLWRRSLAGTFARRAV